MLAKHDLLSQNQHLHSLVKPGKCTPSLALLTLQQAYGSSETVMIEGAGSGIRTRECANTSRSPTTTVGGLRPGAFSHARPSPRRGGDRTPRETGVRLKPA